MTEKQNDGALLQTALRVYPDLPGHAWIRREVIMTLASCSDFKLWEYVRNGELPAPVRVGKRNVAWTKDQVEEFLLRERPKSPVGSNPVGRGRQEGAKNANP